MAGGRAPARRSCAIPSRIPSPCSPILCPQVSCVSTSTSALSAMRLDSTERVRQRHVSFSESTKIVEYVVQKPCDDSMEGVDDNKGGLQQAGPGEGAGPSTRKRGRPQDSRLVKAGKKMERAEERWKRSMSKLFSRRDQFIADEMWDAPSVAERAKASIEAQLMRVATSSGHHAGEV